jgi:hypothetical protein
MGWESVSKNDCEDVEQNGFQVRSARSGRRGTCDNRLMITRQEVETRVLRARQDKLMRKDFVEECCRESP